MSSPGIRPRNNKPATGPGGKHGPQQTLRVLSKDGSARAAGPSIAMPRAKTELSELLAGDELLCVRRRSAAATAQQGGSTGPSGPAAYAGTQAESLAGLSGQRGAGNEVSSLRSQIADGDLARVIDAWPGLPRNVRAGILAMVRETAAGEA
jgi:hypothetical protein